MSWRGSRAEVRFGLLGTVVIVAAVIIPPLASSALAFVVDACGVLVWWLAVRGSGRAQARTELDADPFLIAMVNGGEAALVLAALSSLRTAGLIRVRNRGIERTGSPRADADLHPIEQAVLAGLTARRRRAEIAGLITGPVEHLRGELIAQGLLIDPEDRPALRAWRSTFRWLAVFLVFVVLAHLEASALPPLTTSGFVAVVVVLGLVVGTAIATWRIPVRTGRGEAALTRLRVGNAHLSPRVCPSWRPYGSRAAASGVALFGTRALRTADPELAAQLLDDPANDGAATRFMDWLESKIEADT